MNSVHYSSISHHENACVEFITLESMHEYLSQLQLKKIRILHQQ